MFSPEELDACRKKAKGRAERDALNCGFKRDSNSWRQYVYHRELTEFMAMTTPPPPKRCECVCDKCGGVK